MSDVGLFGIPDERVLFRRIHRNHVRDGRITSAAFDDPELSCDDSSLTDVASALARGSNPPYAGVGELLAGFARSENQQVESEPLHDNPAHVLVVGAKTKACARRLAQHSQSRGLATA